MELTKDDLYEIEKALDYYSAIYSAEIERLCNTAINWSVKTKEKCPLDEVILEKDKARKAIKVIRDKLESIRLS
jgi:hypothetical protein